MHTAGSIFYQRRPLRQQVRCKFCIGCMHGLTADLELASAACMGSQPICSLLHDCLHLEKTSVNHPSPNMGVSLMIPQAVLYTALSLSWICRLAECMTLCKCMQGLPGCLGSSCRHQLASNPWRQDARAQRLTGSCRPWPCTARRRQLRTCALFGGQKEVGTIPQAHRADVICSLAH